MEKIKARIQNDLILFRMIAVFSMVSTVVILVLTTVMFSLMGRELKNEIFRSQEQNLRQVSNSVQFRAEYANSLLLQMKEDADVSKLFFSTEELDILAGYKKLKELRSTVKQLHSVYVCSDSSDRIFYSGENDLSAVSFRESFDDKGFIEIWDNIENYPKYTPILRNLSIVLPSGRSYETYVYTYLIYDSYTSGSVHNIVAFNFHLGWMEDALDFITTDQNVAEAIWIIDSNRQVVYTTGGEGIGSYCPPEILGDEIYDSESGYILTDSSDCRQMVVYATPSRMGYSQWTFVSWNDYASILRPLEQVRKLIYLICAIVFCISLVAVFVLSHKVYEPVRSTINRVKVLEKENEKKHRMEREQFLRQLFLGTIPDDRNLLKILFNRHQVTGCLEEDSQVVLISVDDKDGLFRRFSKHLDEVSDGIESLLRETFLRHYPSLICVRMHAGTWAAAVPMTEGDGLKKEVFEQLNSLLSEKYAVSISMATSQIGHSARDIPYLYSEAVNVHSYCFLWGKNRLITYEDTCQQGQSKFEYPAEIEKRLLSHLFGGKYTETIEDYEAFVAVVRRFTVEEIRLSCMLLAYAIKTASLKTIAEATGMLAEFDRFYKKIQIAEEISEVHDIYYRLIREITDKLKKSSKERHEVLIGQIEAYVEKNYSNISLSMNEISDHVNMSSAYLGRLFKQVTGSTFSEYLTRFRLEKACALLRNTDLTVNEISDMVGFTNSSYFYIIFKKNMDCTPNQYRRQFCNDTGD